MEEQISQIEYFIKKKMDVIVVIPIDGNALYDVLKEAREMGIYIICYDRIVENVNADLYITIDNEKVGTLWARLWSRLARREEIFLPSMDLLQTEMWMKL